MKLSRALFHLGLVFLLAGCWCGGNEDAIRAMRALPDERLAELYQYIESVDARRKNLDPISMDFPGNPVPKKISDLNPKYLRVGGGKALIHISGCVDDKIDLYFNGLNSPDGKKTISLALGDHKGLEILWEQ
ncbi:hypothetical protein [Lysobacter antibioticus]|jgi:hypothetical protein|uniref:hypothetical protein n=1 Tax=Lysobacter antibioticus TaxID=84531 RepID=UPI0011876BB4|nr:hypothetical protein [Lysobacter antibioticus]